MSYQISLNLICSRHCYFNTSRKKKTDSELHTNFGEVKYGEGKNPLELKRFNNTLKVHNNKCYISVS